MEDLRKFIKDQLSVWPLASENFRALRQVSVKTLTVGGLDCKVQYNPCRVASCTADTSAAAIAARPCFLCAASRPAEQYHIKFEGRKGRRYNIQVNPYPIFPQHLVIVREEHIPQAIWHHLPDMLEFASLYPDWTVFYNGPESGASAPDHLHFQAVPRSLLPLEKAVGEFLDHPEAAPLAVNKDASLYHYPHFTRGVFALKAATAKSLTKLFYRLLCCWTPLESAGEPPLNLFCWREGGEFRGCVCFRAAVRSHHYYSDGPDHLSISPGAADMAGFFVAPFERDFTTVTAPVLEEMLSEVSVSRAGEEALIRRLTRVQPFLDVGILSAREISFEIISDGAGPQRVSWYDGRISYNGQLYDSLTFDAVTRSTLFAEPSFVLKDVCIGIGFHWEQRRSFKYAGSLRFIVQGDKITAINRIGLEDYLLSVISSEMKSSSGLELLKAHAVISRSWVLCRMRDRREGRGVHEGYDVCSDDCCQRYQGLTMAVGGNVRAAIDSTWGEVLSCGLEVCDTRYSKCCGGRTELFSTCWEGPDVPWLQSIEDRPPQGGSDFCDCNDPAVLSQVLNDYDLSTRDFYRWTERRGREEISEIFERKTASGIGTIEALEALERGPSGRISLLRVRGSKGSVVIGRELAIRKALSPSCLKSSDFEASWEGDTLLLRGRGWGHGAGLCQIGAAVMACKGYPYRAILAHYYKNTELRVL